MHARLAATYSIVACDPSNGEIGVGVQSHYFSVGNADGRGAYALT